MASAQSVVGRLRGKRVAVLAADGFEYVELAVPVAALRLAGAEVDVISLHSGRIRGMNLTEPTRTVAVDRTLDEAHPDDYDALLIPGGFIGPDLLRQSGRARDFAYAFDAADKPIATLCHGPWLLVSAGLVAGRSLASWPGVRDDIVNAGGVWRDEALVEDGNWVSSRGPQDLAQFVPAMLELFEHGGVVPAISGLDLGIKSVEQASSPRFEQPYALAVKTARLLPAPTVRAIAGAAAVVALGAYVLRRAS
jgi:protease I